MSFMAVDHRSHNFPSFFKIILEPRGDLRKLGIPKKFKTDHGDDLLDVVSLKIPTGKTWKVKLLKENGRAWFKDGWHEIVTYYSICHGHFLMFTYGGMSQFNVYIFDMTACEIEYPLDPPEVSVPKTVRETQIKTNPCSPSSSSKENGMLALVGQYKRKFGTLTPEHTKKINSYKFENPFFTVIMQPSYVTSKFRVNVPLKFAKEYLLKTQGSYTLQNATGDTWPIRCEGSTRRRINISTGWKKYAMDNKLRVGDICVFKLINAAKRLFKVETIRCSSQVPSICVVGRSSPTRSPEEDIEVIIIDE
ncbi:B3 domain-containing transcription factor VRN1-like [Silene latifolia]|uniref:B3 domain-containing transcription factor VRN1-like n=1 Tax=Silene latifolia TaxID=37657 RepID=UPI003D7728A3